MEPQNPPSWDQVANSDSYKQLAPDDQETTRQNYFSQVVQPRVPPEQHDDAWDQFDDYSRPSLRSSVSADFNQGMKDRQAIAQNPNINMESKLVSSLGSGASTTGKIVGDVLESDPDVREGEKDAKWAWKNGVINPIHSIARGVESEFPETFDAAAGKIADQTPEVETFARNFAQQHPNYIANVKGAGQVLGTAMQAEGAGTFLENTAYPMIKDTVQSIPSMVSTAKNVASKAYDAVPERPDLFGGSPRTALQRAQANTKVNGITSQGYSLANDLGATLSPDAASGLVPGIRQSMEDNVDENGSHSPIDLHPSLTPRTSALLDALDDRSEDGLPFTTIDNYRKKFGKIAFDANADPQEKTAALKAWKILDSSMDDAGSNPESLSGGDADSSTALSFARKASNLSQQHNEVQEILRQANGDPDVIQSKMKTLWDDSDRLKYYSPEDQKTIGTLAHPEKMNGLLQKVGKAGFGASGKDIPAWGEAAAVPAALALGNPVGAAAAGTALGVGTAANAARKRIVRNMADGLLQNIEGSSQAVQQNIQDLRDFHKGGGRGFSAIDRTPQISGPEPMKALPNGTTPSPGNWAADASGNVAPMASNDANAMNEQFQADPLHPSDRYQAPNPRPEPPAPAPMKALPAPSPATVDPRGVVRTGAPSESNVREHPVNPTVQSAHPGAIRDTDPYQNRDPSLPAVSMPKATPSTGPAAQTLRAIAGNPAADAEQQLQSLIDQGKYARGGKISDAQKEAGNYKKHHVNIHGMRISIETARGERREGKSAGGKPWSVIMPDHYGYIRGTTGADHEQMDVFLGHNPKSNRVYVIDQNHLHNGKFDEHKAFVGYENQEQAKRAYMSAFSDGKGAKRIGKMHRMSMPEFKDWLKSGDTKKPLSKAA